jgi:hypothetical protein
MRLPLLAVILSQFWFTASATQPPAIGKCPVLPADNIWNTPVVTLPVAANSSTYINTIGATASMHADFGSGLYADGPIGIPFITVPGTQTKYPATFLYASESDPGPYAIPLDAPIEGGSQSTGDRHTTAVDIDNCILYELGNAYSQTSSWQAGAGAIFSLLSNALRPDTWTSTDAAGLPILPGLVRYDEIAAGEIRHAIRFTVPQTQRAYVWPARHYASSLTDPKYPPMGLRVRLQASFDISGFSAANQVILRALKKYGMMLADNGSAWYISGAPDSRWDNSDLHNLGGITGSAFEVVDVSSLMVDPNSGQARQSGPTVASVIPGSGGGSPQTFALTVADGAGAANISLASFLVNSSLSAANGCQIEFNRALNTFRLMNDAGSAWLGPITVGTVTSLANSQCTVSAAAASTSTSGTNLTVYIPLSFALTFSGAKSTFGDAVDNANANSGWVTTGSWTVPGSSCSITLVAPTSVPVGSAGGSGLTIAVSANSGCIWTAVSNATWIHLVSGANGSGSGAITYNVDPNTSPLYQTGTIGLAGQTITLTQPPPVATNTEAFVRQLYLDILSRTADPSGLSTWVNWINTGVYTRARVASQFFQSQEFYGTGNYITLLYLSIMLRDPDYGGWTGWFNLLRNGYTQTDILNAFLASPEFQSRYGSLDNTAFVTLLYNNMLNRAPDQAGLTQWVAWLNNGTYTRAQVANFFITSQEFQLREGNRVYANMLYIGFLRRAGDPNGLNGWTNWLTNGTYTLDQEVGSFIASPEYLARF